MKKLIYGAVVIFGFAGAALAEGDDLASVERPATATAIMTGAVAQDRGSEAIPVFESAGDRVVAHAPRSEAGSESIPDFSGKLLSVGAPDVGVAQTGEDGPRLQ